MARFGSDNGTCLGVEIDPLTQRRIYNPERVAILRYLVERRWKEGGADPLKVFVKQEPHKISKLEEGRLRLISAVSLVDAMIDRMLFGPMWRKAISRPLLTPSAVGWTPLHGGWRLMRQQFPEGCLALDKTAWDWTVQKWLVQAWMDFVMDIHPGFPDWWGDMVYKRFTYLFHMAVFRFQDGVEVQQEDIGIMKSGCYLTLCLNTVGQTILHHLVCDEIGWDGNEFLPFSFGDDIAMAPPPDVGLYVAHTGKYCLVKDPELSPFVQFIGFLITDRGFVPEYWEKHLFTLKHLDPSVAFETLQSYQVLYAYDPVMLKFVRDYAAVISPDAIMTDALVRSIVQE